ncbi:MAG: hypothetical protein MJZ60_01805 [Bacteroidaceae bacterium]|nr:hypothetical protein [Bacteroidaceae bacterium]
MRTNNTQINPFLLTGYVSAEYFCDRVEETEKLSSALLNGRNVALISPRRMGKTGLIKHVFHKVEAEKTAKCYYVDLYQTSNLAELASKLGLAVLGTLDSRQSKIVKKVSEFFKALRPVVSFDPMTGAPSFSVDVQPELAEQSLAEVFAYMEQSNERCYVAFDEFQEVANYEDRKVEALLRAHIQHLTNVHFVFSGSQRHVLESMFTSASRPFYQSCQLMHLAPISEEAYYLFAKEKLNKHGQTITKETFGQMYERLYGHTWYLQSLLNRLYQSSIQNLTDENVNLVLSSLISENEVTYQTFLRLVTNSQKAVLQAIAKERSIKEVQGSAFVKRHKLSAASTVKSAVTAMTDKEMLLLAPDGTYSVYDRFFSIWLEREG